MLKKLISKLFSRARCHELPFWQEVDRKTKIKQLRYRLNAAVSEKGITKAELYSIAEAQQELLTKK